MAEDQHMNYDISPILRDWPYKADANVRKIVGADERAKLQVRLPLGLEQYELNGRPDGQRPEGAESYLDLFEEQLAQRIAAGESTEDFALGEEDCAKLRDESMLYYFRYLLCFQIGEYDLVKRDTKRNMRLFKFVESHAERPEDRAALSQYWPYIVRLHAMAQAIEATQKGDLDAALDTIRQALDKVRNLPDVDTETYMLEKMRSVGVLEEMIEDIHGKVPPNEADIVRNRLEKAIESENYERAAQLRDLLRSMGER